jgi:hypothetical protein
MVVDGTLCCSGPKDLGLCKCINVLLNSPLRKESTYLPKTSPFVTGSLFFISVRVHIGEAYKVQSGGFCFGFPSRNSIEAAHGGDPAGTG